MMAKVFQYKVIDINGEIHEGAHEAESKLEMLKTIRSRGEKPIRVEEKVDKGGVEVDAHLFTRKPNTKDLIVFCRQLYTMLNAGMPLISALEVLIKQSENLKLKGALKDITSNVKKGEMLSEAMQRFDKYFPPLLISMIQAGEMTGTLDDVLKKMSEHYDKENKINSKIKRAMIYPTVLAVLAVSAVTFLLTFVLPVIIGMFEGSGVALPLPTRIVLALSNALQTRWYLFLGGLILIITGYKAFVRTKSGKRMKDNTLLHTPFIKKPIKKIITSRFTRTLSTLLSSGIPILKALETSADVTNNEVLIEGINGVSENIKKGDSLSVLLDKLEIFPKMTVSMIHIGEESGAIEEMLEKTADYYDDELEASLEKLVAIIEPLGILTMGLVIGFIVIAMMLPMFDLFQTI
jgi:type IV pilus assembly protein PilC